MERAGELDRDHVRAWVALGTLFMVLRDMEAAAEAFEWVSTTTRWFVCSKIVALQLMSAAGRARQENTPSLTF